MILFEERCHGKRCNGLYSQPLFSHFHIHKFAAFLQPLPKKAISLITNQVAFASFFASVLLPL
jgi:hypothetical protein